MAARFLLAATALYALWLQLTPAYEQTLIAPANWVLRHRAAHLALAHDGATAVVGVHLADGSWQALALQQPGDAYLSLVAALALLMALPGVPLRRRLAWGAAAVAVLWGSHVLVLYGGACSAAGAYLADLPQGAALALVRTGMTEPGGAAAPGILVGMWTAWAGPAAVVAWAVLALPTNLWRND